MNPVIFLDFDGVLNSHRWFKAMNYAADSGIDHIDPEPVRLLTGLVEQTGARVVVSSTWRLYRSLPELQELLVRRGFRGEVISKTPNLAERLDGTFRALPRAREIEAWLRAHPHVRSFVIFDDDADAEIPGRFIHTDMDWGLQAEHIARAVAILAAPAVERAVLR